MQTVKLKPAVKDYIWGGTELQEWGKVSDFERIAETWELSFHKDGESVIDSGEYIGKPLSQVATKADWGTNCDKFPFFPTLIKLIDAKDNLSVQVHPDDQYALANEGQFGKTEMWYVLSAQPHSGLYVGFYRDIDADIFTKAAKDGSIIELLNFFPVKSGDCFFIEAGTVHAIGKGVMIMEVQQNSNLTYRVFDYFRTDASGNYRQLHIDKAAKVTNFKRYNAPQINDSVLATSQYFTVTKRTIEGEVDIFNADSFVSFTVIEGSGSVDGLSFVRGDTFFVPANVKAKLNGNAQIILTEVK